MTSTRLLTPLASLAVLLAGCAGASPSLDTTAAVGAAVAADVSVALDGSLHADRLLVSQSAADEDDSESEGDNSGDTDNVQCEDGVAPDGSACDDGPDGTGDESEAEDGSDDGTEAASTARSFVRGTAVLDAGQVYRVLNVAVDAGSAAVPTGTVRFDGGYTSGTLAATSAMASTGNAAMGGLSEGIVDHGDGTWALQLLGQSLIVDGNTEIVPVSSPMAAEDESAGEGKSDTNETDGVDCQQEGENQGDNTGC